MSPQGPQFSPHSTDKTNDQSTNLGRMAYTAILGENQSEEVDDDNDYE